jgi:hypothetical protein
VQVALFRHAPRTKKHCVQGNDKAALLCLDPALNDATVEALEAHSNEQLIVSSYALDTAKKWVLQQAYKDNLHVV